MVELSGGHPCRLLNLSGIGKTLTSKGIPAEEPPPSLLQIEPACASRNEELVEAGMCFQPRTRLQTVMTAQIIGDDEDVTSGIVRFNVSKQSDVVLGVTRGRTAGQFLAVAYP